MVEPSKITSLVQNTIPQKEDVILLFIGYHSIPSLNPKLVVVLSAGYGSFSHRGCPYRD